MPSDYGQPPQKLSDLFVLDVDPLQQLFIYNNRTDGIHNRSGVEADESSTHSKPTELPIYFKNPIISLPNVPSNYITNSAAFSA